MLDREFCALAQRPEETDAVDERLSPTTMSPVLPVHALSSLGSINASVLDADSLYDFIIVRPSAAICISPVNRGGLNCSCASLRSAEERQAACSPRGCRC